VVRFPDAAGTGFLITARHVLTAGHVVQSHAIGDPVNISYCGQSRTAILKYRAPDPYLQFTLPDAAILELTRDASNAFELSFDLPMESEPCRVVVALSDDSVEEFVAQADSSRRVSGVLEKVGFAPTATAVVGGWSGGAVVRRSDSRVIGVVITTRDFANGQGGYFVPIVSVAQAIPELRSIVTEDQRLPDSLDEVFALLSWRAQLAPLVGDQAKAALAQLEAWATAEAHVPRVRLLTGPGGIGKTRLTGELIDSLRRAGRPAAFWDGGELPAGGGLIVVDYPEERRAELSELLRWLANVRRPIRLLLLSRQSMEWWRDDFRLAHADHLVDRQEIAIVRLNENDVVALYQAVVEKLTRHFAKPMPAVAAADIRAWIARDVGLHTLPLFVTAVALQSVLEGTGALEYSTRALVQALVDRELVRLKGVSQDVGFRPEGAVRLAAIAAVRGALDATTIERLAEPHFKLGLSLPDRIIDDLGRLPWWDGSAWPAPSPDIVAAALAYTIFKKRKDIAPYWLWAAIDGAGLDIVPRLGRLLHDVGTVYGAEMRLLSDWLVMIVEADAARADALKPFAYEQLPSSLAPFSAAICRVLLRSNALGDRQRAGLLNNLSLRLSESGDRAGALRAIEEAVQRYRRLAEAQPAAFEPALAMSLNNLSNGLSDSGDRAGALRAIEEAVEIRRRLAQAQPAAFEPDLAMSLNNLSNRLSDSGDRAGALRAIEEAVQRYRRLAEAQPAAFEPDLAMSLNTLSNRLSDSGDRAGALRAIEEAVRRYRRLAEAQPAAFEPALAMSLNNLSLRLSDSGDRAGALRAIEEAVQIRRRLAKAQPAAFERALASSLEVLEWITQGR
jgi:hypothetical protein